MQLIFDNLTAILVSAILIGVTLTLNLRSQANAMEATQYHAAKTQQSALIDMLEYDLEDLGSGVPAGDPMITVYEADAFGIKTFEFMRELVDVTGTVTLTRVRYKRSLVGSYTAEDGVTLPRFRIQRLMQAEGGSFGSSTERGFDVVALKIELLGPDGETVTSDLNAATSIKMHLESAAPLLGDLQLASWDGVFRPSNLARRSDAARGDGVGG